MGGPVPILPSPRFRGEGKCLTCSVERNPSPGSQSLATLSPQSRGEVRNDYFFTSYSASITSSPPSFFSGAGRRAGSRPACPPALE